MAAASASDLDAELDRLYQLPLSEFIPARDELAKRLRAEGDSERAQEIKQLRKPTAAVWLVNRLARERQLDVQRLLKAGESMTSSSGTSAEARRDEHHALEQLARAARELAEREGIGSPAVARAAETLRAASLTPEGRELLKRGRLSEELQPPGFEVLTEGLGPQASPPKAKPQRALKEARERVRQLRDEERELATAARAAAREAERAEAEAESARSRAAEAEEQARAKSEQREAAEADLERLGS